MPLLLTKENNILFIHIPKTGGTAIEYWLDQLGPLTLRAYNPRSPFNCSPQHFTLQDVQFLFGNKIWEYAFAIVRDPYTRAESEFSFQHRHSLIQGRQLINFGTWLERQIEMATDEPYHLDNHIRPQTDFIGPDVNVFRYEDGLTEIVRRISQLFKLKLPDELKHIQKRAGSPYFDWSAPLMKKFNKFYEEDFDILKYAVRPVFSC